MATRSKEIVLASTLDIAASEELRNQLVDALSKKKPTLINAAEVTRMSTPCVQILVAANIEAERQGKKLKYGSPSPAFKEAFSSLGLSEYLSE